MGEGKGSMGEGGRKWGTECGEGGGEGGRTWGRGERGQGEGEVSRRLRGRGLGRGQ